MRRSWVTSLRFSDEFGEMNHFGTQTRTVNRCPQLALAPGVHHDQEV
jgi:hypothetical protein